MRDQGPGCSATYAFDVTDSIAGINCAKNGKTLVSLSSQQIIDCSRSFGNQGCDQGGFDECEFTFFSIYRLI